MLKITKQFILWSDKNMNRPIRNSAKALIIKDGKMLTIKLNDNGDVFYIMPTINLS